MRFVIRDKYDEKPIGGVVVRPNLLGDSVRSDEKGILRLKIASNFFDTLRFFSADYYPYTLKVKKGMAYKTKYILMTSRSFPFDTLMNFSEVAVSHLDTNYKFVDGYVYHANLKNPIGKVAVSLDTGIVVDYTNSRGYYSVLVPKTVDSLVLFYPGFQTIKIPAYSRTLKYVINPDSASRKDIFKSQYKNSVSISLLELIQGGIALRYERFLTTNHSVGLLTAVYFFNQQTNYSYDFEESEGMFTSMAVPFDGIKLSPFFRVYPFRNATISGFVETKLIAGYFSFDYLNYSYRSGYTRYLTVTKPIDFWSFGGGVAWGNTFTKNHFIFTISQGIQYFPMNAPKNYTFVTEYGTYDMKLASGWWYFRGAGAIIDLKVSIGWIF